MEMEGTWWSNWSSETCTVDNAWLRLDLLSKFMMTTVIILVYFGTLYLYCMYWCRWLKVKFLSSHSALSRRMNLYMWTCGIGSARLNADSEYPWTTRYLCCQYNKIQVHHIEAAMVSDCFNISLDFCECKTVQKPFVGLWSCTVLLLGLIHHGHLKFAERSSLADACFYQSLTLTKADHLRCLRLRSMAWLSPHR